jgi:hypothetical protein
MKVFTAPSRLSLNNGLQEVSWPCNFRCFLRKPRALANCSNNKKQPEQENSARRNPKPRLRVSANEITVPRLKSNQTARPEQIRGNYEMCTFSAPGARFDANSNRMPDRAENSSSSEEWKANKMNKHCNRCGSRCSPQLSCVGRNRAALRSRLRAHGFTFCLRSKHNTALTHLAKMLRTQRHPVTWPSAAWRQTNKRVDRVDITKASLFTPSRPSRGVTYTDARFGLQTGLLSLQATTNYN